MKNSFFEQVYSTVRLIPAGEVASYGQIAQALDAPRHARVVGWAMRKAPADIPSHRVVKKGGELPDQAVFSGISQKQRLEAEGVQFSSEGKVNMEEHSWTGY
ncbi:methylated-DNA-protein-cysteine methyltransferase-like protein [Alkalihalobacillus xiaoxiensis]|uniref:Methylated-DNA-protein-cysteine methyltransferase-like protein n=1 Tax=Shouchella xiaoxiensis TaxID=766895 RepID=A0ABS2SRR0_9BACI|nr:MGMT family protein [Shouchella xiaoxiensis]MBM7838192.1 methylated-DNA-protein-cysteine methyltransferase-like protein [Shouchella xiaoxiensis]